MSVQEQIIPLWQLARPIEADRIEAIKVISSLDQIWTLTCGLVIHADASMLSNGKPRVGDYYVKDSIGMHGWQAANAFREHYMPCGD